jgi:hypothetical protein
MNKKLLNTQIEGTDLKTAIEIINFYQDNGFNVTGYSGCAAEDKDHTYYEYRFYGVDQNGEFDGRSVRAIAAIKTITLDEAKALVSEYPKMMYVWDQHEENTNRERLVIGKFDKWYMTFNSESIELTHQYSQPTTYDYAIDIKAPKEIHISMEEIAELKGCSVEQLRIKE